MLIRIGTRTFPAVSVDSATLADLLAIRSQTGFSKKDLREMAERTEKLTEEEVEDSDEALTMIGILVWLSRRHAGEDLTLEEACAFPLAELEFILEKDDPVPAGAGGGEDVPPRARREGSDRPGTPSEPRPVPTDRSRKKTSSKASRSA
jgi:hypothetical protein